MLTMVQGGLMAEPARGYARRQRSFPGGGPETLQLVFAQPAG